MNTPKSRLSLIYLGLLLIPHPAQCQSTLAPTSYSGRPAYRLTDGKTEAVVVPSIGRIMRFGLVGGPNILWNSSAPPDANAPWKNHGGDKNWLAPSSSWTVFHGKSWPPDPAFDGSPQTARVLAGNRLEMTSPLSAGAGIRFVRLMYFAPNGDFVIEQTARKEAGIPIRASVWSITQVTPGQAIFLALNPDSTYKPGYHPLKGTVPVEGTKVIKPNLLEIEPSPEKNYKIGLDSKVSKLISVTDQYAFLISADTPAGQYPDGPDSNGFPVELYLNGDPQAYYAELELLGPLTDFNTGTESTRTMRWSLQQLPSLDLNSAAVLGKIEELFYKP